MFEGVRSEEGASSRTPVDALFGPRVASAACGRVATPKILEAAFAWVRRFNGFQAYLRMGLTADAAGVGDAV